MHSLTLVLSSPRSGSTLLCRDLASLGGLGFPREYLRGLDAQGRQRTLTEADVLDRIAEGRQDASPGVTAVKVMVPQAPAAFAAVSGRRVPVEEAMSGLVGWARERFDRVLLVFLFRNTVDQAISRVVADATGIFHSSDPAFQGADPAPLDLADANRQIFAEMVRVVRNRKALDSIAAEHADIALVLTYDELVNRVDETTAKIVAHARAQGFEVLRDQPTRKMEKVVSPERAEVLRESFLDYLRTEPGV